MQPTIDSKITDFNKLYGLPTNKVPTIPFVATVDATIRQQLIKRLEDFKKIIKEEADEIDEIVAKVNAGDQPVEILTELSDLLGDLIIYNLSEMKKFGLDSEQIILIIMASNMSKLGLNGAPVYDERGKVMKGPNYWKPEPMIQRFLEAELRYAELLKKSGKTE